MKENDVIIVFQNKLPQMFAVVQSIVPDMKKGWWVLTIQPLILENTEGKLIPMLSWILRDEYLEGADFTMGGIPMVLKVIEVVEPKEELPVIEEKPVVKGNVTFVNFRKKEIVSEVDDGAA